MTLRLAEGTYIDVDTACTRIRGDGIYEYRKFCVSSRGDETGGFVEIKGTEVRKITRADAIAAVS